jgi:hypothetical protein
MPCTIAVRSVRSSFFSQQLELALRLRVARPALGQVDGEQVEGARPQLLANLVPYARPQVVACQPDQVAHALVAHLVAMESRVPVEVAREALDARRHGHVLRGLRDSVGRGRAAHQGLHLYVSEDAAKVLALDRDGGIGKLGAVLGIDAPFVAVVEPARIGPAPGRCCNSGWLCRSTKAGNR